MTREEIAALVATLGGIWATLQEADPADKAEVYRHLELGLTYKPQDKLVEAKVEPAGIWGKNRVGEGTLTIPPWAALRCELVVP